MRAGFVEPVAEGRSKRGQSDGDQRAQKHLGRAIRVLRERAGLTQAQLGKRSELHQTWISHLESGHANIVWGNLRRIAIGLGVKLEELLSLTRDFEMAEAVGLAVRNIREEQGFAPATVAERASLTAQKLAEIESGAGLLVSKQLEGGLRRGLRVQRKRWYRALNAAKVHLEIP